MSDANKPAPREFWVIPDNKVLYSNRRHRVYDIEQAREHQETFDGEFGMPNTAIHVIEYASFEQMREERDELREKLDQATDAYLYNYHMAEHAAKERDLLRAENATLSENLAISNLAALEADRLRAALSWTRDGIEHFTHDEDQKQVQYLIKEIDKALGEK